MELQNFYEFLRAARDLFQYTNNPELLLSDTETKNINSVSIKLDQQFNQYKFTYLEKENILVFMEIKNENN
jgi:hypothetical protein